MDWTQILAGRTSRMKASEIRELLKLLDQPDIISFAGGIPDPALFPVDAYRKAMDQALSDQLSGQALQYSVSEGYRPLRDWIVQEMARIGVTCDVDNILITSGSQQGLDYLGKMMIDPGDTVLLGWPTYMGALGAFNAYEPHYEQLIPGSNRGAMEYMRAAEAAGGRAKFAYLSVDFANPTGETLDLRQREAVLDLAEEMDISIVEDAAYQALRYRGEPLPPILALEQARKGDINACRTLYAGSFSKTLAPGLRVGWICGAKDMIARLVLTKQASDLHSPTLNQIATHIVADSIFAEHVDTLRAAYGARLERMLAALADHMPDGVRWTKPEGGMFVWVTLPDHMDGADLLVQALETAKVAFVPGRAFFADGSNGNTLRLNFSNADEAGIEEGIRRLGDVIRAAGVAAG